MRRHHVPDCKVFILRREHTLKSSEIERKKMFDPFPAKREDIFSKRQLQRISTVTAWGTLSIVDKSGQKMHLI